MLPGQDVAKAAALSAAFWAFTYLLFSARSYLAADVPVFFSGIRMAATAVGAIVLWGLLVDARRQLIAGTRLIPHIIIATAFATIAVLSVRVLYVSLLGDLTHTIEDNLRWAMLWAGYCGAAISLYLLAVRQARSSTSALRTTINHRAARPARSAAELDQQLQWIVDAIAEHIATAPDGLNDQLAESLSKRAGYLSSDAGTRDAQKGNVRVEMTERVLEAYRRRVALSDPPALRLPHVKQTKTRLVFFGSLGTTIAFIFLAQYPEEILGQALLYTFALASALVMVDAIAEI